MNDPLGWAYPAGAENDPNAPWNQKDEEEPSVEDELEEALGKINRLKHSLWAATEEIARLKDQIEFLKLAGLNRPQ
jgi:hypothetical protein